MKNQYFGDINDYRKFGLIRALQETGEGSLLVAWMLTPDDGCQDGGFRSYLQDPSWAKYDQTLFNGLVDLLQSQAHRSVSLLERTELLPRAKYYSAIVPDGRSERYAWQRDLLSEASGVDLVFLDPDNGIEVPSKPVGCKGSSKYVTWQEIQSLWKHGCSLLIYQHFRREKHDAFTKRLVSELERHTGARYIKAFSTSQVLFLLAAQNRHVERFEELVPRLSQQWSEKSKPLDWLTVT